MYIWNIFKTLIYLLFCSTKFVYSEPDGTQKTQESKETPEAQDSKELTGIDLNLCVNRPTNNYDFRDEGKVEIFTPKRGFGFSLVKAVDPKTSNEKVFWKANDISEFSNSVNFFKYTLGGMFGLTIKLLNGDVKSFYKEKGKNWTEVNFSEPTPISISIKPLVSTYSYRAFVYQHHARFVANKGFVFNSVVNWLLDKDKKTIWEAASPKEYCNQIILDGLDAFTPTTNITTFYTSGIIKHFTLSEKKWINVYPKIYLHLGTKKSTYDFEYFMDDNFIEYYTANGILGFRGVRFPQHRKFDVYDVDIWAADSRSDYAYKVFVVPNINEIFVIILLWKGEILIFHKRKNSFVWDDHSNEPFTINQLRILGFDLRKVKPPPDVGIYKVSVPKSQDHDESSVSDLKEQVPPPDFPSELVKASDVPGSESPIAPLSQPKKPSPYSFEGNINLIVLDITEIYGIIGYNIEYQPNKVIFRAKTNNLFRLVKCKENILWKNKDNEYPYKVIYKEVNGEGNLKVYFPDVEKFEPISPNRFIHHYDPSEIKVDVIRSRKRNLSV